MTCHLIMELIDIGSWLLQKTNPDILYAGYPYVVGSIGKVIIYEVAIYSSVDGGGQLGLCGECAI